MADIYVVSKGSDVFIGELKVVGENGIHLLGARRDGCKDPFSAACFAPDDADLSSMGPIVNELVIYRPDLLLKPYPIMADALRSICGTGAIAHEP